MNSTFNKCIPIILKHEGGFQKMSEDLGNWIGGYKTGKLVGTKYGIAARFFPWVNISDLTVDGAKAIYYWFFWSGMNMEFITNELAALHVFDFGINAGRKRAIRTAQQLCGIPKDGVIGPITADAINNYNGNFVKDYKHARKVYYEYIATKRDNHKFLKGWLLRVDNTHF